MTLFQPTGKKILALQALCLTIAVITLWMQGITSWLFLTFISYFIVSAFGLSLTLHRTISHRAWIPSPLLYKFLCFLSCFSLIGSPLSYTYIHRMHHAHTDKDKDPHTPKNGIMQSMFGMHEPEHFHGNMIRDLLREPYQLFLHKYYLLTLFVGACIIGLLGINILIYGLIIPGILCGITSRFHNWATHEVRFGYKTFNTEDSSRNIPWLNVVFLFSGEGWANNHHAHAWDYDFGKRTQNIDIVGKFVDWCVSIGLGQYNPNREGRTY